MSVAESKGSWIFKALAFAAFVGVLIAVGTIVLKVFTEEDGTGPDAPTGV